MHRLNEYLQGHSCYGLAKPQHFSVPVRINNWNCPSMAKLALERFPPDFIIMHEHNAHY